MTGQSCSWMRVCFPFSLLFLCGQVRNFACKSTLSSFKYQKIENKLIEFLIRMEAVNEGTIIKEETLSKLAHFFSLALECKLHCCCAHSLSYLILFFISSSLHNQMVSFYTRWPEKSSIMSADHHKRSTPCCDAIRSPEA